MSIEAKEEFKDKIYSVSGFVDFVHQKNIPLENITSTTNNGLYILTGELIIPGKTYSNDSGGEIIECVAQVFIDLHTDTQTTHTAFNNIINRITVDYAYHSP
jgi:hypothetical protein